MYFQELAPGTDPNGGVGNLEELRRHRINTHTPKASRVTSVEFTNKQKEIIVSKITQLAQQLAMRGNAARLF